MPKINNFLQAFQDSLPGLKDFKHASRLYLDDNFKLAPKNKFLFHVVFNTDETLFFDGFSSAERYQLNMLVKSADLPKYGLNVEEKIQYNKKMYAATRIQYEPVNIVFHDDQADTVNAFWKKYYEYHIADSVTMNTEEQLSVTKDDAYDSIKGKTITKFGMDTPIERKKPYLKSIELFTLHKKRFTSMTLVNPLIGSFSHDNVDHADGLGILTNSMQIFYETVIYKSGIVNSTTVPGFATLNYDKEPSPLSVLGRGTNSIFGPGGVVDGVGSTIRNFQNGNILGAILSAGNTYNRARKIKKQNVKQELRGLAKEGIRNIAKASGPITNPVAQFAVGAAALATIKPTSKKGEESTRINQPTFDSVNFLTADEAFRLVENNEQVRDQVSAGIYYKDIGSRKNLTVAQSDVEFAGASDSVKTVYTNKTLTDIRKLVTEGYVKISRENNDVNIDTEKANL